MNTQKNPYIGPRTFQRNEGHLFFGREREARDLISLVASERLVVFYAQSGAGKSSIVNTRLIPNLEEKEYEVLPVGRVSGDSGEGLDVNNIYVYNVLRSLEQHDVDPSTLARLGLAQFLCQLNYDDKGFFYDPTLPDSIPASDDETVIRRALIIDQFEELFSTHPEAWEKRENFFQQVSQAMQDDPHLWIVLVMREDYIAALDPYAHLVSNGLRVRYYMQRLGREAGLKAVKSPVEGIRPYAEGVAEKLIDDLCSIKVQQPDGTLDVQPGQYVEPVQMQVVCYGLWDNLSPTGTQITEQDLQDVGDVNQSLGKYYDRRVSEVAKARDVRERMIREWFEKKLITAGGIRNMVLQEREPKPGELSDDVIQALQSDLVRGEKRGGATWYELTHDRLVEPILERNKIWFSENLSPLQRQAALWKDQDWGDSWLLRDQALIEVEQWAKEHHDELNETEKEFLEACRKLQAQIDERHAAERHRLEMANKLAAEEARSAKRSRIFNVVSGVLIVIALFTAFYALRQRQDADQKRAEAEDSQKKAETASNIAHSGELSIAALERADSQLDLAILLGVKAHSFYPTSQSEKALLTLLQKSGRFAGTLPTQENVQFMQYSPDGKTFASLNENGITLWNAETRKALNTQPINGHYRSVTALALNETGNLLASGAMDGTILLWNSQTYEKLTEEPFKAGNEQIVSLAFSPDAKILAAAGSGAPRIILWDITDPKNPQQSEIPFPRNTGISPTKLAFSPDGKTIASGSDAGFVMLWNVETYQPVSDSTQNKKKHGSGVSGLVFDSTSTFLLSTSYDSNVFLWDVKNVDQPLVQFPNETSAGYNGIAVSPDDQILATAPGDGSILLWDISNTDSPFTLGETINQNIGFSFFNDLAFSPTGDILASASSNGDVVLWDVKDPSRPQQISTARGEGAWFESRVLFTEDGKTLITASFDSMLRYWDVSNPRTPTKFGGPLQGHSGEPTSMQFSPDGSILKSESESGALLIDVKEKGLLGRGNFLVSPDANILAYQVRDKTTGENTIYLKNIETGELIAGPISGQNPAFSPDSKKIVYQAYDPSGITQLHLWDLTARKESKSPGAGEYIALPDGSLVKFSPDSAFLAYQVANQEEDGSLLNLWDIAEGKNVVQDVRGEYLQVSSDGKVLVYQTTDDESQGILRDIATAEEKVITGSNFFASQDGTVLAYTTTEAGINVLDIATGALLIEPIKEGIFTALSQNGKVLLYATADNLGNYETTALDITTGAPIGESTSGYINQFQQNARIFVFDAYDYSTGKYSIKVINTENNQNITIDDASISGFNHGNGILTYIDSISSKFNLWDTAQNKAILSEPTSGEIRFQDDQMLIYQTVESDGTKVHLFNLDESAGIGGPINGTYMAHGPDGKILATKSGTDDVMFWNVEQTGSLGELVSREQDAINSAALNPDGKTLAFANTDGIHLQNTDGSQTHALSSDHVGRVNSVVFSPDKKHLATIGEDNQIIIWDASANTPLGEPIPGIDASFSPDGRFVAVSRNQDNKSTVTVWNLASWKTVGEPILGSSGTFSPDSKTLFVIDLNVTPQTVTLFDVTSQQTSDPIQGSLQISSTSARASLALVDTANSMIRLWGSETPITGSDASFAGTKPDILVVRDQAKEETTFWNAVTQKQIGEVLEGIYTPIFSPDGRWMLIQDSSATLVWDMKTQEQVREFKAQYYPTFCADNTTMAWFDSNIPGITIWDLEEDQSLGEAELDERSKEYGGAGITFSPDCSILAIGQNWDNKTRLWDISKDAYVGGMIDGAYVIFSPDGSTLLASDGSGTAAFWNVSNAAQHEEKASGNWGIYTGPENSNIAVILNMDWSLYSWSVTIWDLNNRTKIGDEIHGLGDPYMFKPSGGWLPKYSPIFTSDGKLVIYDEKGVRFWDVEQNEQVGKTMAGHSAPITNMLFSPDGKTLTTLASDGIAMTDVENGSSIHLDNGDYIGRLDGPMAFNQDGTRLTALGSNNTILVWDLNGDSVALPTLPKSPSASYISRSALSPDGNYLVYESSLILKVWNIARGEAVKETELKICCGGYIVFSPDGKSLFYNEGGTVFRWDEWNDPASDSKPGQVFSLGQAFLSNMSLIMGVDAPRYLVVSYDQSGKPFTQIWELDKNTRVGDPIAGNLQVLGSNPHTQVMIYKDNDGRLFQWDLNPDNWIRTLCAKAGRNFTTEEWDQYIGLEEIAYQEVCP